LFKKDLSTAGKLQYLILKTVLNNCIDGKMV